MLQLLRRMLRRPSELRPGYEWLHCWDPDVRCEWCGRRSRSRMLALVAWTRPGEALPRPLDVGHCCAEKFVPWEQEPCTCPECARPEIPGEEMSMAESSAETRRPPVKAHEHEWVTLWTSPAKGAAIPGASVLWRCSRRSRNALRVSEHKFRRPTKRQQPNVFSQGIFPRGHEPEQDRLSQ